MVKEQVVVRGEVGSESVTVREYKPGASAVLLAGLFVPGRSAQL